MGKFANKPSSMDAVGAMIAPPVQTKSENGFDAFGKHVPFYRRANAYEHCKDMGLTDKAVIFSLIESMADKIQRDDPHTALEIALQYVDVTGCYRLLAVLCSSNKRR